MSYMQFQRVPKIDVDFKYEYAKMTGGMSVHNVEARTRKLESIFQFGGSYRNRVTYLLDDQSSIRPKIAHVYQSWNVCRRAKVA